MMVQAELACKKVQQHPVLSKTKFNVLGWSQGGMTARYIVESCDLAYPVHNFMSIGAPNGGQWSASGYSDMSNLSAFINGIFMHLVYSETA